MPVSLGGGVLGAGHDVEAAVLGHHPVLLGLRVHHARQPGLLPERVPRFAFRFRRDGSSKEVDHLVTPRLLDPRLVLQID